MKPMIPAILLLIAIGGPTAGCRKYDGEKAAAQRNEWHESLSDSISAISTRRNTDSLRLVELRESLAERIGSFTQVSNPREVEPYYIQSRFKTRYPLSSTGIAARMTAGEQAEIIAALSGPRFNAIRLSDGNQSVESDVVPADQALNYTARGLTTVSFTGAKADSICMFVADHQATPLTLTYLQDGARAAQITLNTDQKEWIASTWGVCGAHKEARMLEKRMLSDSRKIELLKITLAQEEEKTMAQKKE